MNIDIPKTLSDAIVGLNGLNALLTAKQWERAAIVYAFTEPGNGQGERTDRHEHRIDTDAKLSVRDFAEQGISGLTTQNSVRMYRRAWQKAIDAGAPDVHAGDSIEFDPSSLSIEWSESFGEQTTDVQERVARQVLRERPEVVADMLPKAVETVIAADIDTAHDIAEVVAGSRVGERVHSIVKDKHEQRRDDAESNESRMQPPTKPVRKVIDAINGFFEQQIVVQGVDRTYREVIQFVLDNPDLSLPNGELIATGDLRTPLLAALDGMRSESAKMLDALALTAGEPQP
jgi:hypothetical protein